MHTCIHTTSAFIQYFCLYLNQQTAASNVWTFCVCTVTCTHTPTQQTYSVIHLAIQLSYLFVLPGIVLHHYVKQQLFFFHTEQYRLSTDDISVYRCKSSACTFIFYDVSKLFCFPSASLRRSSVTYMTCVYNSNTHAFFFSRLSPKVWSTTFSKKLPVPKNNLAASWLVSRMRPLDMRASCPTSLRRKLSFIAEVYYTAEYRT